jgi:hypothetical protein
MATLDSLEDCLDLEREDIESKYRSWDKGDCSKIGLAKIILYQEITKHIQENGIHYDGEYDEFLKLLI